MYRHLLLLNIKANHHSCKRIQKFAWNGLLLNHVAEVEIKR